MAHNLKVRAVKGAGINIVARFFGLICHFMGVIILARLLTPKDFGLVAMVTSFSLWFMNFGLNGFTEYIIQRKDIGREEINSIFWLQIFIASILSIGFTIFGIYLADFYDEPDLWGIAAALSISFVLMGLCTSHIAILKKDMKFTGIALVELAGVAIGLFCAITAAMNGMSYWSIVIRQLTIPTVMVVGAWILCPWRPTYPQQISHGFPALKYAIQVYSNYSIGYVVRNIDKVLLGKYYGTEILGNYDRAYHLSIMPQNQLLAPLHSVALATLCQLKNDKIRFIKYYTTAVSMIAFLGAAIALILTISADDIIRLLLGPGWEKAGSIVRAFGPGIAAMLVYGTHPWIHLSLGTPKRWLRWNVFSAAITIAAFIIAAPYGGVAMALAYSVTAYILVIPALWYAGRPIDCNVKIVIGSLWPYFVSAGTIFAFWVIISGHWVALSELLGRLHPISKIPMVSVIVLVFYWGLVSLLQLSFRSTRLIGEFIGIFVDRRKVQEYLVNGS